MTSDEIDAMLDDKDWAVRRRAFKCSTGICPHHINKALDDNNYLVRLAAIEHSNAQPYHIDKALNDKDWFVRIEAIRHPNAQPHHIDKALDDKDWFVRIEAISHPLTTDDQKIEYKLRYGDID